MIFSKPASITKSLKNSHDFKLDVANPRLRGIYLEEALLLKIIKYNKNTAFYRTEGHFSARQNCFNMRCEVTPSIHKQNLKISSKDYLLLNGLAYGSEKESYHGIPFIKSKILKSQFRCLAKVSIDYCFIDLILDNTLIDIKTDINTKRLYRYFRQALMQSVQFSSFGKGEKSFKPYFTSQEINSYALPIDSVAIYYWRSNEYFKFFLDDILEPKDYNRLVDIYKNLYSYGTLLRNLLRTK